MKKQTFFVLLAWVMLLTACGGNTTPTFTSAPERTTAPPLTFATATTSLPAYDPALKTRIEEIVMPITQAIATYWQLGYTELLDLEIESYVNFTVLQPGEDTTCTALNEQGERILVSVGQSTGPVYCPIGDMIVVPLGWVLDIAYGNIMGDQIEPPGEISLWYIMAHEYAHNVQEELGLQFSSQSSYELWADCAAGVAIYSLLASQGEIINDADFVAALQVADRMGDLRDPSHHGSPRDRGVAFTTGFSDTGLQECMAGFQ